MYPLKVLLVIEHVKLLGLESSSIKIPDVVLHRADLVVLVSAPEVLFELLEGRFIGYLSPIG